jgi:acetyl esterase/lipase
VTFNYRGSWGSPGTFSFAGNLEDAVAVLTYLRDPKNAQSLGIDAGRIAIAGHSMGGWVAAKTGARDPHLIGVILICAADMGAQGAGSDAPLVAEMADNKEALAGVTAQSMAQELERNSKEFSMLAAADGLAKVPLLVLTTDDGLAADGNAVVKAVQAKGSQHVSTQHVATDHGWSDRRIELESIVINWLRTLH